MTPATRTEQMIVSAARALAGVRTVFVGVGMPNIACNLARQTVSPELELIYESGVYGARPSRLPLSIGDPALVTGSIATVPMADLFGLYLQGGHIEVAFLGGAQIDRHGNLNTTVIGNYAKPKVRLPGSGGAAEIATSAQKVFVMIRLSARSFVRQLDFTTSPGFLTGGEARRAAGLLGNGPQLVVTDHAIFNFANDEHQMQVVSLYPGVRINEIRALIGWGVREVKHVSETDLATNQELTILREVIDPNGLYAR